MLFIEIILIQSLNVIICQVSEHVGDILRNDKVCGENKDLAIWGIIWGIDVYKYPK